MTRRQLLGTALAASVMPVAPGFTAQAQQATPVPGAIATPHMDGIDAPGFGIARVRTHPTPDLAQAVYPDVIFRFLPPTAALPEYFGYIFAFDDADPRSTINVTLLDDASAADAANAVAEAYSVSKYSILGQKRSPGRAMPTGGCPASSARSSAWTCRWGERCDGVDEHLVDQHPGLEVSQEGPALLSLGRSSTCVIPRSYQRSRKLFPCKCR